MKNVAQELKRIDAVIARGPFEPTWESLQTYRVPEWYQDAKFGIFIHWGVYAVPGFNSEWYPRQMYLQGTPEFEHHVKTYGPQRRFGYKDFIPLFQAQHYSAARWARLFKRAGAKFVMPVAEHHDGFAMYASGFSKWCAAKMGPRRDCVGELAAAVRQEGMVFCASSHRAEHWFFMNGGKQFPSDVQNPKYAAFYGPAQPDNTPPNREWLDDWLARTCELVDLYRPQVLWFDWWIEQPAFKPYLRKLAAYYYNRGAEWGLGVAINFKHDAYPPGTAVFDVERGQLKDIRAEFWQTDTAVAKNSWGYVAQSAGWSEPDKRGVKRLQVRRGMDYKQAGDIIGDLVDIVSKNGAMLLNIGPRADGTIPAGDERVLLEIGDWLAVNGEAVYGTRPWTVYGEGPTGIVEGSFNDGKREAFTARDIRFTRRGANTLYAVPLAWPERDLTIHTLGADLKLCTAAIERIELLGAAQPLRWTRAAGALKVRLPDRRPCRHAPALRITLQP
jgi:alpha-L-fucosidase